MRPRHVGFIMDGNRRFSKRLMQEPWKGHEWGAKKFREVLDWCFEEGLDEATFYAFSIQNFNRPKIEFEYIMDATVKVCDELLKKGSELDERGTRVRVIGRRHLLPERVQAAIVRVEERTAHNSDRTINIAMAYGGREELVDAVRAIADKVKDGVLAPTSIDEGTVSEHMYMPDEPDLIIRTGGDHRTSNFLVWQSWYSEWCFIDKFWPEFSRDDFEKCLDDFDVRERRFGR